MKLRRKNKLDFLTPKQEIILQLAEEKGFVTTLDIKRIYSTKQSEQLRRLIDLGYLAEDFNHLGRFKLTGKSFK